MSLERLDKVVSVSLGVSRADARRLIASGRVVVDGATARQSARKLDPGAAELRVGEQILCYRPRLYLLMNKPLGRVCSTDDPDSPTVLDLVPPELSRRGLFPAGRLDKYSEGMLILTDDGDFAHRMLSPRHHVPKTYDVEVDRPVVDGALAAIFARGMSLGDGERASPALLECLTPTRGRVTIREGLYHQVRRMFDQNGARVTRLARIRIGGLPLDESLAPGACRLLTEAERALLLER